MVGFHRNVSMTCSSYTNSGCLPNVDEPIYPLYPVHTHLPSLDPRPGIVGKNAWQLILVV